jgi:hypothetical protein
MNRYSLVISEDERFHLLVAVSTRVGAIGVNYSENRPYFDLLRRLLEVPTFPEGQASAPSTAASGLPRTAAAVSAARQPAPVVTASEKPVAEREKAEREKALLGELTITPTKVDQPPDGASMIVHYSIRTANQERKHRMHCWDPSQFGTILETVGKSTTFLTKATKTGFVNIVGVKK